MTQTSTLPRTDALLFATTASDELLDAFTDAINAAGQIQITGGQPQLIGLGRTAAYGPLVKIETERFRTDTRGATWAKVLTTYATPADAEQVLDRMMAEGRRIDAITAVRAALGGTTRV